MNHNMSLVHGPKEPQLYLEAMSGLVDDRAVQFGDRTAVVFPWQHVRLSYRQLADRSKILAKAMLARGLRHGDCVGIMAGNCYEYIEVFLGGARIGCPVVVLNNTYTPAELENAVYRSCKSSILGDMICYQYLTSSQLASSSSMPSISDLVTCWVISKHFAESKP